MFARFAALCPTLATLALALVSLSSDASAQKVFTVAGGYVGDNGPATSASLAGPEFEVFDGKGNLLISDSGNCRIRKVGKQGTISTIAGTGICGFSGDGGPAALAKISFPGGIVIDAQGDILFSDSGNLRIRKIDLSGKITTVAGKGKTGFCGDGGPAVKACLGPVELAIGSGRSGEVLYIADTSNNRIRKIVTKTGIITTVAGNGQDGYSGDGGLAKNASLDGPFGVAVDDPSHTLWISDTANSVIRRVDTHTGIITTVLGNGRCGFDLQSLCFPDGIAGDGHGNLYISEQVNERVVELPKGSNTEVLLAGTQTAGFNGDGIPATSAFLNGPFGVNFDPTGNLVIADGFNNRVRTILSSGNISTVAGGYIGDGRRATSASLNLPQQVAFDRAGNLYIADSANNRIRKVSPAGRISTFAGTGITGYSGDGGLATSATLNSPSGVAADGNGNIFIGDTSNQVIRKVDASGTITTLATGANIFAGSLVIDASGNLYAADSAYCVVWKIPPTGTASVVAGVQFQCGYNSDEIPATQAFLQFPLGVALDAAGNLYIGDSVNNRVRMVDSSGIIHTVAGNGTCGFSGDGGSATQAMFCSPQGVETDANGTLYIADAFNARIRAVSSSGTIETFAGDGNFGFNGNGRPATKTDLGQPSSVVVNSAGVLFVSAGSRVRKVQ